MARWILHSEYYGEGGGKALPVILSDREKGIIEMMEKENMLGSQVFKFVEVMDVEGESKNVD